MRHDYSLAHLTALHLSPPELVDAAAAGGYRYVGLRLTRVAAGDPLYPLATDASLMRETKARLAHTGVEVLDIELARLDPYTPPESLRSVLETGAELAEATHVLHSVNRPNAGMLIDLLHFARSRSSVEELKKLPRSWFRFAHVCDAAGEIPATREGLIHTARAERLFPGEGGIDVRGILAALPPDIPYALEIPRATLSALIGERECARLAITAARRHLEVPEAMVEPM